MPGSARKSLDVEIRGRELGLRGALRGARQSVVRFASDVRGAFSRVTRSIFNVRNAAIGLGTALAVGGAARLTTFAAEIQTVESSFRSLAKSFEESPDQIIRSMQRASDGTIAAFDLMKLANTAMLTNVARTPEAFEGIVRASTVLGRAMGVEATQAFEKLSLAISRQSDLRLDDLGIVIAFSEAQEREAKRLGKTVAELTKAEKATAFFNEANRVATDLLGRLGGQVSDLAIAWGQFRTEVKNLGVEILKDLTPALTQMSRELTTFVRENRPAIIRFAASVVNTFADVAVAAVNFAKSLEPAIEKLEFFGIIERPQTRLKNLTDELREVNLQISSLERSIATAPPSNVIVDAIVKRQQSQLDNLKKARDRLVSEIRQQRTGVFQSGNPFVDAIRDAGSRLEQAASQAERASTDFAAAADEGPSYMALAFEEAAKQAVTLQAAIVGLQAAQAGLGQAGRGFEPGRVDNLNISLERQNAILAGMRSGVQQLHIEWTDTFTNARNATIALGDSIAGGLTNALTDFATGAKSAKEAFRDLARGLLTDLSSVINRMLVLYALQQVTGFILGRTSTPGAGAQIGGNVAALSSSTSSIALGAGPAGGVGGILSGLGTSAQLGSAGYQHGGVRGPRNPGVFGEGSTPELAVPIPGGYVPVRQVGAGGRTIVIQHHYHFGTVQTWGPQQFEDHFMRTARDRSSELAYLTADQYVDDPNLRGRYAG